MVQLSYWRWMRQYLSCQILAFYDRLLLTVDCHTGWTSNLPISFSRNYLPESCFLFLLTKRWNLFYWRLIFELEKSCCFIGVASKRESRHTITRANLWFFPGSLFSDCQKLLFTSTYNHKNDWNRQRFNDFSFRTL